MAATTTTTDTSSWERFRAATQADVLADVPQHVQRLGWSARRIEAAQRDGLRRLLAHAPSTRPSTVDVWAASTSIASILPICRACP